MKYTSTIKSRQFIVDEDGKKIFIEVGNGDMSDAEASAVANSAWGKRLVETGMLKFEKEIKLKEKIERGMTKPRRKPEDKKESSKDPAGNTGDLDDGNQGGGDEVVNEETVTEEENGGGDGENIEDELDIKIARETE